MSEQTNLVKTLTETFYWNKADAIAIADVLDSEDVTEELTGEQLEEVINAQFAMATQLMNAASYNKTHLLK